VRVPTFDRPDDPRQSAQPSAEESLDVFAGEAPGPSSGRFHVTQPDKLIIVEIEERPGDSSPLDSFATERVERQPVAPPEIRFDSVPLERTERFERIERLEQPERIERSQRFGRSAGLLGLAAVAIVTVITLNWARGFVASPSEAPAEARVENPPGTEDRLVAFPEPAVTPTTDVVIASSNEPVVAPKTPLVVPETTPVVVPKQAPVVAPTVTARTVIEPPLRAPRAEIVSRPVAESVPPPAQVPTTGVAPVEVRGGPSAALPIVSTIGSTTPTTAVVPAASPAAAATVIAAPPAGPPVPDAAAAAAARVAVPRAAVESVLGRYARAFSSLDARSAKTVWPNVNQRNLERAFEGLQQQHFDLGACDITVLPPRALALCDGTARYTPKVGDRKERIEPRRWTFHLRQDGQDWSIENIDTR